MEGKKFGSSGSVPSVLLHISTKNQADRSCGWCLIALSVTCGRIVLVSFSYLDLNDCNSKTNEVRKIWKIRISFVGFFFISPQKIRHIKAAVTVQREVKVKLNVHLM